MDREPIPAGDFIQQRFLMRGTVERDTWKKTFPDVIPSTHVFFYEWDADNASVIFGIRPKPVALVTGAKAIETANKAAELAKLPDAEIETRAIEAGVAVAAGGKKKPKSQIAAEIAGK